MNDATVIEIVDDNTAISLIELVECVHVERTYVIELVDSGLLEPIGGNAVEEWRFAHRDLRRLRAAQRLMSDLDVNAAGAAVILDLIEERDSLLKRVRILNDIVPLT